MALEVFVTQPPTYVYEHCSFSFERSDRPQKRMPVKSSGQSERVSDSSVVWGYLNQSKCDVQCDATQVPARVDASTRRGAKIAHKGITINNKELSNRMDASLRFALRVYSGRTLTQKNINELSNYTVASRDRVHSTFTLALQPDPSIGPFNLHT